MTIEINGESKRLGLALSGGGFRAAAYHLGVFKKLDQLGLLGKLDLLSCVSGGSIAGGTLAINWGSADALDTLENYLKTKSIAVSSFLSGALDPFHTRLDKLADTYDRDLFSDRKLNALASGPRVYFNSTNISTGNMFFFVSGGGKPEEMGEHELGVVPAPEFKISRAVAASSAFPPVFPPLRLDQAQYNAGSEVEYVSLADGGVYDNMAINPTLLERNDLDYLIVSDGGKPFEIDSRPTEYGAIVLTASIGIMMEQVRGLEFDRIKYQHKAGLGPKPLWFSIDSIEGEAVSGDARYASSIGTNLKALSDHEMEVLMRHGGALLESRIARYAPELLG